MELSTEIGTSHKPHASDQLSGSSDHVFCQPSARDIGVALYVALAMIKRWAPNATVTITPTDRDGTRAASRSGLAASGTARWWRWWWAESPVNSYVVSRVVWSHGVTT